MVDSVRLGGFEGPHVRSNCKPELKRHDPLLIAIDSGCQIVPETFGTDRLFFASGRRFAPVLGDSAGAPRTAASTKRSRGITEQIARTASGASVFGSITGVWITEHDLRKRAVVLHAVRSAVRIELRTDAGKPGHTRDKTSSDLGHYKHASGFQTPLHLDRRKQAG